MDLRGAACEMPRSNEQKRKSRNKHEKEEVETAIRSVSLFAMQTIDRRTYNRV